MSNLLPTSPTKLVLVEEQHFLTFFDGFVATDVGDGAAANDTIRTYRSNLKQFLRWCEQERIHPISATFAELKQYRHWLVSRYQKTTISLKLSVLRRFYDALLENGYILSNPALRLKPPREVKDPAARFNYLQREEMRQLLFCLPEDDSVHSLRDRLLISVMVLEGCRTVEMHRVNVGDIVKDGPNVGLQVWAKQRIRVVPLTPDLASLLRKYLSKRRKNGESLTKETPLFVSVAHSTRGQRLSRRSIRRVVDKYLQKIGLKELPPKLTETPKIGGKERKSRQKKDYSSSRTRYKSQRRKLSAHSLRHTAGTLSLRAGASLRQIQDLLGHADPRTTIIYAHIADRWQHNPALLLLAEKPQLDENLTRRIQQLRESLTRINPLHLTLHEEETLRIFEKICA
ncbi:tyrosine-type recombinase/integrase [Crocosphaera sp.]|uniref:tyrosine-type recombinase/integrase n=1 Tax=Crocosphaera sp. TaxID=2729996 RepID=UPI00261E00B2|nr:tyrosine-type recombinase/integrase [Crocosphaera sp.]MDJ0583236.1 tyrosine-type recombinase/integrase [Crocosphaera sp.]